MIKISGFLGLERSRMTRMKIGAEARVMGPDGADING